MHKQSWKQYAKLKIAFELANTDYIFSNINIWIEVVL